MKNKKKEFNPLDPIRVGKTYENNEKPFNYKSVNFDGDKWADASKFLPQEFDLCHCRIKDHETLPCWYTGLGWDGLKMKPEHEVLFWKLNYDV